MARRIVPAILLVAALCLAGALVLGGCGGEVAPEGRIVLIGVDGLCWETLGRWEAAEENADYAWFRENAYVGPLETIMPTKSPIIWTSVATGARPEDHGVVGFLSRIREFYDTFGGQTPISSLEVKRYPFWEIITERPSYVVGWWATWPALPLNGVVVSDKFYFWRDMMKHGESCGPATQIVYPPELECDLTALRRGPDSVTTEEILRFLDVPVEMAERMDGAQRLVKGETLQRIEHEFPLLYSMDETYYAVAETLLATGAEDGVFAIYIRGPDIMGHATMFCSKLYEDTAATPQDREWYGEALTRYYAHTFARLRELVELAGDDALVLIASDHGFERPPEDWVRWGHGHKPDGTIIALGGGLPAADERPVPAHIYDLAPTVLWLAGHAAASDMPGRPLTELYPDAGREVLPRVTTYGVRTPEMPDGALEPQAGDEQMVELLRSLGYIE